MLALFCGIIAVGLLVLGRKDKVVAKANADGSGCALTEQSRKELYQAAKEYVCTHGAKTALPSLLP